MKELRVAGLALVGLGVVQGCSRPSKAAQAEPAVLRVRASEYGYVAPDSFSAGLTTVRVVNEGAEPHHIQIIRLESGKTPEEFFAAVAAGGPPPAWIAMVGGPNAVMSGDSTATAQVLEPGTHVLLCFIPAADGQPHVMKGMQAVIEVTPGTNRAAVEPRADLVMKLVDYGFELSGPLRAGTRVFRVENAGPQPHEVVLARLEPGKTLDDLLAWEHSGMAGEPPARWLGGVVGLDPGTGAWFSADITPGRYVLICFFPDAGDGKPHLAHGMVREIEVS